MKPIRDYLVRALVTGLVLAMPVYLAVLLMLKGMKSLAGAVRPLAALHPRGMSSAAAEQAAAFLVIVAGCCALGAFAMTAPGRAVREWFEQSVLVKIPGYALVRSLTQQLAGQSEENAWKPALAELGASVVVAFIIEETDDGRYTVFVPSVPSPVVGSVHILRRERVHPVEVPLAQAFHALSRWGSGARNLVAALEAEQRHAERESKAS